MIHKFNIDGQEDRRTLAAIFADNGYDVKIETEERRGTISKRYFLIVEEK